MQENRFRAWLEAQEKKRKEGLLNSASVDQYILDGKRVEKVYEVNLDELVKDQDRLDEVLQKLECAAKTRKQDVHLPDPKALFGGGYRTAVNWYLEFLESCESARRRPV